MTNEQNFIEDSLSHYGVLGMKWGVRRTREQLDRAAGRRAKKKNNPNKRQSQDHQATSSLKKRKTSSLSNKQLKKVNERLNLEKKFKDLNPGTLEKGRRWVVSVAALAALGISLYDKVHSPAGKAATEAGKKVVQLVLKK